MTPRRFIPNLLEGAAIARRHIAFSRTYHFLQPHRAGVLSQGEPRRDLKMEALERNSILDGDASEAASPKGLPNASSPQAQEAPRR
jgi:hypothetical protein